MKKEPTITHILADGRKVDTVAGLTVPADNGAYDVLAATIKTKWGANECQKWVS